MNEIVQRNFARMRKDYAHYAKRCLVIKNKKGDMVPFTFNRAQRHIHTLVEHQLSTTGMVRVLLLKARQQGGSTYTQGRLYWRTSLQRGKTAFILTHEDKATKNLFRMGKRFHDNTPRDMRPTVGRSNENELMFKKLDSSYAVGTARSTGTGRSFTAQYFHGSEVAMWANASDHMSGLGQAIPTAPGTEVFLESTANGVGNPFYEWCMEALKQQGDYQLIFTPWYWSDEYARPAPAAYQPTGSEADYQAMHELSLDQMYWRYRKIIDDFDGEESRFGQEYPATVEEAFLGGVSDVFLSPLEVMAAMRTRDVFASGAPIVLGVDPAEYGKDATAIVERQGRRVSAVERHYKKGPMEVAGIVAGRLDVMKRENRYPDAVFVDATGVGSGVADRLIELHFKGITRVHFGGSADNSILYARKRDECWGRMRAWLREPPVELPDDQLLKVDMASPLYSYDSSRRLLLESKEAMRRRGVSSPDSADALALTFAYSVTPRKDRVTSNMIEERRRRAGGLVSPMGA